MEVIGKLRKIYDKCLSVSIDSHNGNVDYTEINESNFDNSIRHMVGLTDDEEYQEFRDSKEFRGIITYKKMINVHCYVTNHVGSISFLHYDFDTAVKELYDAINEHYDNFLIENKVV